MGMLVKSSASVIDKSTKSLKMLVFTAFPLDLSIKEISGTQADVSLGCAVKTRPLPLSG